MKKLVVFTVILLSTMTVTSGQGFKHFFNRVPHQTKYEMLLRGADTQFSQWMFRPAVTVEGARINFGKADHSGNTIFSSVGAGLTYGKFTYNDDGVPYMNFAVSVVVLAGQTENITYQVIPSHAAIRTQYDMNISIMAGIQAWQYLSLGAGYDFTGKQFFVLTGVTYNFN